MWTATHFPSAMRSLNLATRAKAIEIANDLMADGHTDKHQVIMYSISQARAIIRRQLIDGGAAGPSFQSKLM